MFCEKCGAELAEGALFCEKCGQKVEQAANEAAAQEASASAQQGANVPADGASAEQAASNATTSGAAARQASTATAGETASPKTSSSGVSKLLKSKGFLGAAGAVIAALIVIIVIAVQPKKIDLNDYVTVEFNGYETIGTARVVVDEEGLTAAVAKALKISEKELEEVDSFYGLLSGDNLGAIGKLYACLDLTDATVDKSTGLSNGDVVTLSFECDNEAAREFGIVFKGKDKEYTVEGLSDINIIDAFADLTVSFSGVAPNGGVELEYSGIESVIDKWSFGCDKSYGLRNGDTVTVTLNINEEYLHNNGYAVKETTRTYTVEGLDEYVESYSDLTEEFLDYTKSEAQDIILAYVAQRYNTECSLGQLEYAGYIFEAPKPDSSYWNNNELYVIYKGTVAHAEGKFHNTAVYFPVHFYNILSTAEGISCDKDSGIMGSSRLGGSSYSTNGYVNPLVAYTELATARLAAYQVEAGDGFEVFESYTPIAAIADISAEDMASLESAALDSINTYLADVEEEIHANDTAVMGYYLLNLKTPGNDFSQNNRLYVVYQTTLTNDNGDFEPTPFYFAVEFDGLVNLPNGEFMYDKNVGLMGRSELPRNSWWGNYRFSGYADGTVMFNELVTANRTNYSYEVSEGLKVFGE